MKFYQIFIFIGVFFLVNAEAADELAGPVSVYESYTPENNTYQTLLNTPYSLFIHDRTYLLPVVYNWTPHTEIYSGLAKAQPSGQPFYGHVEAEFQISFFFPIYRRFLRSDWDLLAAYTHHAWWQIYNSAWSKPFRETNYRPELFFRKVNDHPVRIFDLNLAALDLGYMHESNGQVQVISRSWDRLFARGYFLNDNWSMALEAWIRLPEKSNEDDNEDIQRYRGVGQIVVHKSIGSHSLEVKVPFAQNGGVELMYSYPWREHLRWFVTGRTGYGHSLIEYKERTERIGVGITLENLMDKNDDL